MHPFSSASHSLDSEASSSNLRRILVVLLLTVMASALPAAAQSDGTEWQLYGGTSFLWARTTPQLSPFHLSTLNEWGWQTDITQYPWHWFGGTLEASGFYGRPDVYDPTTNTTYSNLFNSKHYTIMFGPSFTYNRNPHFQPFGHVLLGGVNEQFSLTSKADPGELFTGENPSYSKWIFGWALGGGADISINRLVAIRAQVDWLPTTFKNLYNDRENNIRLTVGLVFRFGGTSSPHARMLPGDEPSSTQSAAAAPAHSGNEERTLLAQNATPPIAMRPTTTPAPAPPLPLAPQAPPPAISSAPAPTAASEATRISPTTTAPTLPAVATANATPHSVVVPPQSATTPAPATLAQRSSPQAGDLEPGGASNTHAPIVAQPAPPPPAAAAAGPPTMVEFWSRPTGADVEIDGQYVGNTFSTIAVPPGEHIITIRKQDYATWQRTIRVTSGNVRVAAYLEQVHATVTFH